MTTTAKTIDSIGDVACPQAGCVNGWLTTRTRTAEMGRDEYGLSSGQCHRCKGTGRVVVARPPQIACGDLPDPSGLIAWVIADPDEDTHRLVYADYLDEQEQHQRAEYIRSSINWPSMSFVTLTQSPDPFPLMGLVPGEPQIQYTGNDRPDSHWAWGETDDGCAIIDCARGLRYIYDRGFCSRVRCTWQEWCEHGDALRKREWVPHVTLTTRPQIYWSTEAYPNTGKSLYRIAGREFTDQTIGITEPMILARRWPGTTFTLPA